MEKDIKRVLNLCYEDGFQEEDIKNRHLYLNGDIDASIIESIVYHITRYNQIDKDIPVKERKRIKLYINSAGGYVTDGFSLIDAAMTSATPVDTINLGLCASMGYLVFLAGNKRYTMPHAEFLMHDGSTMGFDSTAKVKDRIDFETGQLANMIKEYVLSRTGITKEKYDEKYRMEWYFLADEAKELGVVDYIVGKDCTMDEIL